MGDVKQQLEWVRDVRKKRLAVITCAIGKAEKVVKTFHLTQITEAEKYAASVRPSRITDTANMEVIRWYAAERESASLEALMDKFRRSL